MVRLIISIFLWLPTIALADFYRLSSVPASLMPAGFDRVRAAALQIRPYSGELGCSATIISNAGHVLTALHCLDRCVEFEKVKGINNFRALVPSKQQILAGKAACSVPFYQENRGLGNLNARIVAAGPGYVFATDPGNLRKELDKYPERRPVFSQLIEAGIGIPGDFAILYVPSLANRVCAKTSAKAARLNERVWNIAYPGSFEDTAVFSHGLVTYSAVSKVSSQVSSGSQAAALLTQRNGMFVSSIGGNDGSSGSSIHSYQGDLVGVLNAAGSKRYASRIDNIINSASVNYGAAVVAQSFSCQ